MFALQLEKFYYPSSLTFGWICVKICIMLTQRHLLKLLYLSIINLWTGEEVFKF